jgi:hypothetical protein
VIPIRSQQALNSLLVYWVDSSGRRNTSMMEVFRGGCHETAAGDVADAGKMRSPGRPPGWHRDQVQRFWIEIAKGISSEGGSGLCRGGIRGWDQVVPGVWQDASHQPRPYVWSLFVLGGARGDRDPKGEGLWGPRYRPAGGAFPVDDQPGVASHNAATRPDTSGYRAVTAQWHANRRTKRPKPAKLAANEKLRSYVQDRLAGVITAPDGKEVPCPTVRWIGRRHGRRQDRRWGKSWSPEQISNRLRVDFPDDETMRISHEAIYQALYVQGRGALRRELVACLRTGRALRVPRARTQGRGKKFVSPEVMISERPAEAEDRAVRGDWEGDLIIGLNHSAIGTDLSTHSPNDLEAVAAALNGRPRKTLRGKTPAEALDEHLAIG